MRTYIPTPYLAILFYLAYSDYKRYNLKSSYLPNFPEWITDNDFEDKVNIVVFEVPRENAKGEEVKSINKEYFIKISDRQKLKTFLSNYIKLFKADILTSTEKFYSYDKNMLAVAKVWDNDYNIFGKPTSINISLDNKSYPNKYFRIIEVLLSLIKDKHIELLNISKQTPSDIENQFFQPNLFPVINIGVKFLKSPREISDNYTNLIEYKGLKVNEKNGEVIYKNKEYKLLETSQYFKMLCYLIKNSNKKISFDKILNNNYENSRDRIKSYHKSIVNKLRLQKKPDNIHIKISSKYIILE